MKKYTQILADYLADLKYENIPAEVIERAKMVTLHTVGVALGAAKAKTVREAIEVAKVMGESERGATIFGDGSKVSVTSAAFANGMMSDFLDWEDCSWTGHPCSGAVPAGLAVAEAYGKSGKDYLTSFVGGFEVYQRIAMAVQPTPERFDAGWGLYCWQIFAPTAVSGKLLNLSADKLNQLRHVRLLPTIEAVKEHMKKHAEFLRPRFEAVERKLTEGLGDTGCATWTHPRGGYFVSFDGPEGSAQKVAALCADLGVKLTPAGATWPYGKDPRDTNIRIAPSYPTVEDLEAALDVLVLAVKLVAAELARAERA